MRIHSCHKPNCFFTLQKTSPFSLQPQVLKETGTTLQA